MKKNFKVIIAITVAILLLIVVGSVAVIATTGANKDTYSSHMELAQQYLDELKYELAIAEYEAAIAIEPNNAEAYLALAEVYVQLEDFEAAIEVLERGIAQTNNEELAVYLEVIQEEYIATQIQNEVVVEISVQNDNEQDLEVQTVDEDNTVVLSVGKYIIDIPEGYSINLWAETDAVVSIYTMEKSNGDTKYLSYKETYNVDKLLWSGSWNYGVEGYITYITIYSGSFIAEGKKSYEVDAIRHWDSYENLAELEWYSETDVEAVFGMEITEGQTVTIDNQNYNGDILYCDIQYYVKGSDDLSGYDIRTDYWWRTYMGFDETESTVELTAGTMYYSFLKSCNKIQYAVTSGSLVWYTEYTNKDLLVIY